MDPSFAPPIARFTRLLPVCVLFVFTTYLETGRAAFCPQLNIGLYAFAFAQTVGADGGTSDAGCDRASNNAETRLSRASAVSDFGVNRAFASGTTDDRNPASSASAESIWTELIIITGGIGTGLVTFGAHIDGFLKGRAGGAAFLQIDTGDPNQGFIGATTQFIACTSGCDPPVTVDRDLFFQFMFTYGQPFLLEGDLKAEGDTDGPEFRSDFISTMVLNVVILPEGAVLNTQSGTSLPITAAISEPSTGTLLAVALFFLACSARRHCLADLF